MRTRTQGGSIKGNPSLNLGSTRGKRTLSRLWKNGMSTEYLFTRAKITQPFINKIYDEGIVMDCVPDNNEVYYHDGNICTDVRLKDETGEPVRVITAFWEDAEERWEYDPTYTEDMFGDAAGKII
jgi:hypothetical protein